MRACHADSLHHRSLMWRDRSCQNKGEAVSSSKGQMGVKSPQRRTATHCLTPIGKWMNIVKKKKHSIFSFHVISLNSVQKYLPRHLEGHSIGRLTFPLFCVKTEQSRPHSFNNVEARVLGRPIYDWECSVMFFLSSYAFTDNAVCLGYYHVVKWSCWQSHMFHSSSK